MSRTAESTSLRVAVPVVMASLLGPDGLLERRLLRRVAGGPAHAPAPLLVEVAHPYLVVDGALLLAAVEDVARAVPYGAALAVHGEQVLVQVPAEGTPDRLVVQDPLAALRLGVAF